MTAQKSENLLRHKFTGNSFPRSQTSKFSNESSDQVAHHVSRIGREGTWTFKTSGFHCFANFLPLPILFLGCDGDDRDRPTSTDRPQSTQTANDRHVRPTSACNVPPPGSDLAQDQLSMILEEANGATYHEAAGSALETPYPFAAERNSGLCGHHWSSNPPTRLRSRRFYLAQQPRKRQQEAGNA